MSEEDPPVGRLEAAAVVLPLGRGGARVSALVMLPLLKARSPETRARLVLRAIERLTAQELR